ncbi:LytS/YhcK type 5TM receptor domain-containing protein [Desulfuribacillus stibiiarsenatis]|uniref:LytS/YhcK type 5TM receptor domain-containing protein n=1 Tax=Desulfuribacillus stibiiarsenatis TaxID=1390249 RepID=UPI0015B6744B|nr:LytS/YhcK type 5TM receptor domain-containing protein [Desulfuribacillus stibiiarsenatis]
MSYIALYQYQIQGKIQILTHQTFLGSISVITILACMSVPIEIDKGMIFDFRYIPFTIGVLYGGWRTAIVLFFTILAYRFYIGGVGVYLTLIGTSLGLTMLLVFLNSRDITKKKNIEFHSLIISLKYPVLIKN